MNSLFFFVRPFADLTQITCIKPDIRFEFALLLSWTCRNMIQPWSLQVIIFRPPSENFRIFIDWKSEKKTVQRRKITTINIVNVDGCSILLKIQWIYSYEKQNQTLLSSLVNKCSAKNDAKFVENRHDFVFFLNFLFSFFTWCLKCAKILIYR